MAVETKLTDQEIASMMEIAHPSKGEGESIYGTTTVFPDYQAEPGETYLGMVHGIAHESSVSFSSSASPAPRRTRPHGRSPPASKITAGPRGRRR